MCFVEQASQDEMQLEKSDPYLRIKLGDKVIKNDRKNHFTQTSEAPFFTLCECRAELPGVSKLKIQVMDYDYMEKDDIIGETNIDLDDRWLNYLERLPKPKAIRMAKERDRVKVKMPNNQWRFGQLVWEETSFAGSADDAPATDAAPPTRTSVGFYTVRCDNGSSFSAVRQKGRGIRCPSSTQKPLVVGPGRFVGVYRSE